MSPGTSCATHTSHPNATDGKTRTTLDPGVELGLVEPGLEMAAVELAQELELALLPRQADVIGRSQVGDRLGSIVQPCPLADRRDEAFGTRLTRRFALPKTV